MKYLLLICLIFLIGCNQNNQKEKLHQKLKSGPIKEMVHKDTISDLELINDFKSNSLKKDSLEFDKINHSLLYMKSGYFLSQKQKTLLIIQSTSEEIFETEFYVLNNDNWVLKNKISNPFDLALLNFDVRYKDYDFDGVNDIYIQKSASNGLSLSYGYLYTVNTDFTLKPHAETKELPNMFPDKEKRLVYNDTIIDTIYGMQLYQFSNKWIKGNLKRIKKSRVKSTRYD